MFYTESFLKKNTLLQVRGCHQVRCSNTAVSRFVGSLRRFHFKLYILYMYLANYTVNIIPFLFSCRYCFVENLAKEGLMTASEYVVLDEWFKWITSHCDTGGDLIGIYE
jgi:hypothetical protein